jgi:hypothetical protein
VLRRGLAIADGGTGVALRKGMESTLSRRIVISSACALALSAFALPRALATPSPEASAVALAPESGVVEEPAEEIVVPKARIAARTARVSRAPGSLAITSAVHLEVYEGAHLVGSTPLQLKLSPGLHELRFVDKAHGINVYRTYSIKPNDKLKDDVRLGKSRLMIDAPYGAAVVLNSRMIGYAPMEAESIFEGEYAIEVSYHGASWVESFSASPGDTIHYRVTFKDVDEPVAPAMHAEAH